VDERTTIDWLEGEVPVAAKFGDVYYSRVNGLAETRHVFLQGQSLRERFQNAGSHFVIGELGFGTGLNFLAAVQEFYHHGNSSAYLHFVSVEGFHLAKEHLARALKPFTELDSLSQSLIAQYPPLMRGFHQIHFSPRVTLTLILDEVVNALQELDTKVDAWFLDGFSPEKNSEMWSEAVFNELARNSANGTTFSTFSTARVVKDNAYAAGFVLKKLPGFHKKREMLFGYLPGEGKERWRPEKVAVIGAGLAGSTVAASLARYGIASEIFEQHKQTAAGPSGNPKAVLLPYFTRKPCARDKFYRSALSFALNQTRVANSWKEADWTPCGVVQLTSTERLRLAHEEFHSLGLPKDVALPKNSAELKELTGVSLKSAGFHYPTAGYLTPKLLVEALLANDVISLNLNTKIKRIEFDGKWTLYSTTYEFSGFDAVVVAGAYEAQELAQTAALGLTPLRGQLNLVQASADSARLKTVLCYDGYVLPAENGTHLIGASFEHGVETTELNPEVADSLLERVRKWTPSFHSAQANHTEGRVSFRTTTKDKLPLAGQLKNYQHLFVSLGHGSRGLLSAPITAEQLVSELLQIPNPIGKSTIHALRPERHEN